MSEALDVDAIAPSTPELEAVAINRTDAIVKEWARLLSIHGMMRLPSAAGDEATERITGLRALAIACYVQGARDASAVAATYKAKS